MSTEAGFGKILLTIGIILGAGSIILLLFFGIQSIPFRIFPAHLIGVNPVLMVSIKVAGIGMAVLAFYSAKRQKYQLAGFLGIVATLLPPLDVVIFLGSLLFLISPEARMGSLIKGGVAR